MAEQVNSETLRNVAMMIERKALTDLSQFGDFEAVPVIGDMQYFPRATPEARAAQIGFRLLREVTDDVVAMLYALAEAADRKVPLSESPLLVLVRPYIALYELLQTRGENGSDTNLGRGAGDKNRARGGTKGSSKGKRKS
jgi:hypothetical protein